MDFIDDWIDYQYDADQYIREQKWDNLSLQYVSDELTEKYKNQLNWSTIATNWPINASFYEKFKCQLEPYQQIIKLRQQYGFIRSNVIATKN